MLPLSRCPNRLRGRVSAELIVCTIGLAVGCVLATGQLREPVRQGLACLDQGIDAAVSAAFRSTGCASKGAAGSAATAAGEQAPAQAAALVARRYPDAALGQSANVQGHAALSAAKAPSAQEPPPRFALGGATVTDWVAGWFNSGKPISSPREQQISTLLRDAGVSDDQLQKFQEAGLNFPDLQRLESQIKRSRNGAADPRTEVLLAHVHRALARSQSRLTFAEFAMGGSHPAFRFTPEYDPLDEKTRALEEALRADPTFRNKLLAWAREAHRSAAHAATNSGGADGAARALAGLVASLERGLFRTAAATLKELPQSLAAAKTFEPSPAGQNLLAKLARELSAHSKEVPAFLPAPLAEQDVTRRWLHGWMNQCSLVLGASAGDVQKQIGCVGIAAVAWSVLRDQERGTFSRTGGVFDGTALMTELNRRLATADGAAIKTAITAFQESEAWHGAPIDARGIPLTLDALGNPWGWAIGAHTGTLWNSAEGKRMAKVLTEEIVFPGRSPEQSEAAVVVKTLKALSDHGRGADSLMILQRLAAETGVESFVALLPGQPVPDDVAEVIAGKNGARLGVRNTQAIANDILSNVHRLPQPLHDDVRALATALPGRVRRADLAKAAGDLLDYAAIAVGSKGAGGAAAVVVQRTALGRVVPTWLVRGAVEHSAWSTAVELKQRGTVTLPGVRANVVASLTGQALSRLSAGGTSPRELLAQGAGLLTIAGARAAHDSSSRQEFPGQFKQHLDALAMQYFVNRAAQLVANEYQQGPLGRQAEEIRRRSGDSIRLLERLAGDDRARLPGPAMGGPPLALAPGTSGSDWKREVTATGQQAKSLYNNLAAAMERHTGKKLGSVLQQRLLGPNGGGGGGSTRGDEDFPNGGDPPSRRWDSRLDPDQFDARFGAKRMGSPHPCGLRDACRQAQELSRFFEANPYPSENELQGALRPWLTRQRENERIYQAATREGLELFNTSLAPIDPITRRAYINANLQDREGWFDRADREEQRALLHARGLNPDDFEYARPGQVAEIVDRLEKSGIDMADFILITRLPTESKEGSGPLLGVMREIADLNTQRMSHGRLPIRGLVVAEAKPEVVRSVQQLWDATTRGRNNDARVIPLAEDAAQIADVQVYFEMDMHRIMADAIAGKSLPRRWYFYAGSDLPRESGWLGGVIAKVVGRSRLTRKYLGVIREGSSDRRDAEFAARLRAEQRVERPDDPFVQRFIRESKSPEQAKRLAIEAYVTQDINRWAATLRPHDWHGSGGSINRTNLGAGALDAALRFADAAIEKNRALKRVNLNTASVAELQRLPGVSKKQATAIAKARKATPILSLEGLNKVKGIGRIDIGPLRGIAGTGEDPVVASYLEGMREHPENFAIDRSIPLQPQAEKLARRYYAQEQMNEWYMLSQPGVEMQTLQPSLWQQQKRPPKGDPTRNPERDSVAATTTAWDATATRVSAAIVPPHMEELLLLAGSRFAEKAALRRAGHALGGYRIAQLLQPLPTVPRKPPKAANIFRREQPPRGADLGGRPPDPPDTQNRPSEWYLQPERPHAISDGSSAVPGGEVQGGANSRSIDITLWGEAIGQPRLADGGLGPPAPVEGVDPRYAPKLNALRARVAASVARSQQQLNAIWPGDMPDTRAIPAAHGAMLGRFLGGQWLPDPGAIEETRAMFREVLGPGGEEHADRWLKPWIETALADQGYLLEIDVDVMRLQSRVLNGVRYGERPTPQQALRINHDLEEFSNTRARLRDYIGHARFDLLVDREAGIDYNRRIKRLFENEQFQRFVANGEDLRMRDNFFEVRKLIEHVLQHPHIGQTG